MTGAFEDRKPRHAEAKWAGDRQTKFAIMAKRNGWLGQWAAETMQLPTSETGRYVQAVIDAGMFGKGKDPVFDKIRSDFEARMLACPDAVIQTKMRDFFERAVETVAKFPKAQSLPVDRL